MWQSYKRFCQDRGWEYDRALSKFGMIRTSIAVLWTTMLWVCGSILYLCLGIVIGTLAAVTWLVKWLLARLLHIDMTSTREVARMSGEEFERYVAKKLRAKGYTDVQFTPTTGDYGVDITAVKGGVLYAFQCKRYTGSVGVAAVQEVFAGSRKYGADRAVVITNSTYTPNAKTLANDLGVSLWELEMLDAILE